MRHLIVVPLYHLQTLYNQDRIFKPLDSYMDLPTLLQMCFDPPMYGVKFDIWDKIEAQKLNNPLNTMAQSGVSIDSIFGDKEAYLCEMLDVMIDMFIDASYRLLKVYIDMDSVADHIRSFKVVDDSVYILIEK